MSTSFYVPHDIEAPIAGSVSGPLAGLTAAVKDLYDVAGTRTGGGSPEWLAAQQPARAHAAAVAKILAAGATVTGKTACDGHLVLINRQFLRTGEKHDRRAAYDDRAGHRLLAFLVFSPMQIAARAARTRRHAHA